MVKNPSKIFFSRTGGPISTKLGMSHRGLQPNHNVLKLLPWVDLDLFFGKGKYCNFGFDIEKLTVVHSLEIIAVFDLEIG